jgi:hypothetical protein
MYVGWLVWIFKEIYEPGSWESDKKLHCSSCKVPIILWNVTVFVQQMHNIYKHGNIKECFKKHIFLIHTLHITWTKIMLKNSFYSIVHSIHSHVLRCTFYLQGPVEHRDVSVRSTDQHTTWNDFSCLTHPHWTQPTATCTCPQLYLQKYSVILHTGTTIHQKAYPA